MTSVFLESSTSWYKYNYSMINVYYIGIQSIGRWTIFLLLSYHKTRKIWILYWQITIRYNSRYSQPVKYYAALKCCIPLTRGQQCYINGWLSEVRGMGPADPCLRPSNCRTTFGIRFVQQIVAYNYDLEQNKNQRTGIEINLNV